MTDAVLFVAGRVPNLPSQKSTERRGAYCGCVNCRTNRSFEHRKFILALEGGGHNGSV
jgi:hypothetical protein